MVLTSWAIWKLTFRLSFVGACSPIKLHGHWILGMIEDPLGCPLHIPSLTHRKEMLLDMSATCNRTTVNEWNEMGSTVARSALRAISAWNPNDTSVSTSVSFTGAALDASVVSNATIGSSMSDHQCQHPRLAYVTPWAEITEHLEISSHQNLHCINK